MLSLDSNHNILSSDGLFIRTKCNQDKVLVFEKGNLLFVFNWHHN